MKYTCNTSLAPTKFFKPPNISKNILIYLIDAKVVQFFPVSVVITNELEANNFFSYLGAKKLCSHLGGALSMDIHTNFTYIFGDSNNCYSAQKSGIGVFWIPVIQGDPGGSEENRHYSWLDDSPGSNQKLIQEPNWRKSEPNGLLTEQCVTKLYYPKTNRFFWNDESCFASRCSVCKMPVFQKYQLRGPDLYDHKYSLALETQQSSEKIEFEGEHSSWIIWYPLDKKTELHDQRYNFTKSFHLDPFGLLRSKEFAQNHSWIFSNVITFKFFLQY